MTNPEPDLRYERIDSLAFAATHPGGRGMNEDAYLLLREGDHILLAVADGLGGHSAGEIASRRAVDTLREMARQCPVHSPEEQRTCLWDAFEQAHRKIRQEAEGGKEGMGTTLVAASIQGRDAVIANTGDSRGYLIRDKVVVRTRDHSVVQRMVANGTISKEEARGHPLRNLVTAALGLTLEIDLYPLVLEPGDTLLLASDGFVEAVPEDRIVNLVQQVPVGDLAEILLREALGCATDNVTLAIYQVP